LLWRPLSDAWARSLVPGFYPFNDMHATMAFVGAGDLDPARELVMTLKQSVDNQDQTSTAWILTSAVGLPVCRSLLRFGDGDYAGMVDEFWPVRRRLHAAGSSGADRGTGLAADASRAGSAELADARLAGLTR
jgi:hypothetical protein